jgi:hypothetical protein
MLDRGGGGALLAALLLGRACVALVDVGPPVTRVPAHRSRRAIFPHRALRGRSLPH